MLINKINKINKYTSKRETIIKEEEKMLTSKFLLVLRMTNV